MKPKPITESFRDWENSTFGFGYGTGEPHTIAALKTFLASVPDSEPYNYESIEAGCGSPAVAWLLINCLCGVDIIEYGSSPRFGWLTPEGIRLKDFVAKHTVEEMLNFLDQNDDNVICSPDACNCGPTGYLSGVHCNNPFWPKPRT